jgi:hypothetical protein
MAQMRFGNTHLDNVLRSEGVVDHALYMRFAQAYGHEAASTVAWIEGRLKVLLTRLRQGKPLSLYMPDAGLQVKVQSSEDFHAWVSKHFPNLKISAD